MRFPGQIAIGAGVLALIPAWTAWYFVSAEVDSTIALGWQTSAGKASLLLGLLLIVCGWVNLRSERGGLASAIWIVVLSLLLTIVGGYSAFAPERAFVLFEAWSQLAGVFNVPIEVVEDAISRLVETGQLQVASRFGPYLTAVAGVMGLIAGVIAVIGAPLGEAQRTLYPEPASRTGREF
jgi:hypothetical protein